MLSVRLCAAASTTDASERSGGSSPLTPSPNRPPTNSSTESSTTVPEDNTPEDNTPEAKLSKADVSEADTSDPTTDPSPVGPSWTNPPSPCSTEPSRASTMDTSEPNPGPSPASSGPTRSSGNPSAESSTNVPEPDTPEDDTSEADTSEADTSEDDASDRTTGSSPMPGPYWVAGLSDSASAPRVHNAVTASNEGPRADSVVSPGGSSTRVTCLLPSRRIFESARHSSLSCSRTVPRSTGPFPKDPSRVSVPEASPDTSEKAGEGCGSPPVPVTRPDDPSTSICSCCTWSS